MAAMAVLSTGSGQMTRSLEFSCSWPISYCPKQFINGQAKPFLQGLRIQSMAVLSRPANFNGRFTKAGKPQWPFYQQLPLYQGEARSLEFSNMAVLSRPANDLNGRFIKADGRFIKAASPNGRFISNGRFIKAKPDL